ncbi:hypothetical protein IG631_14803 [Alternaria alternata]|nr:hypothetical protein IG631_14803 [Alternaria alternata]
MGTENKDMLRGEEALRKIDANTLAACAKVRVSRARCGCGRVGRVRDSGMRKKVPYERGIKWQRRSWKNGFDVAAAGSQLVGVVFLASEGPRYWWMTASRGVVGVFKMQIGLNSELQSIHRHFSIKRKTAQ